MFANGHFSNGHVLQHMCVCMYICGCVCGCMRVCVSFLLDGDLHIDIHTAVQIHCLYMNKGGTRAPTRVCVHKHINTHRPAHGRIIGLCTNSMGGLRVEVGFGL